MNNDQASSGAFFFIGLAIALGAVRYKLGTFSAPDSGLMPFLVGAAISSSGRRSDLSTPPWGKGRV